MCKRSVGNQNITSTDLYIVSQNFTTESKILNYFSVTVAREYKTLLEIFKLKYSRKKFILIMPALVVIVRFLISYWLTQSEETLTLKCVSKELSTDY